MPGIKNCPTRSKRPEHYRAIGRKSSVKIRTKRRIYVHELKKNSNGCVYCGESNPLCLDFDHIDPSTKKFTPANGITNGTNWAAVLEELDKCQLVCRNCHGIKSILEGNKMKGIDLESIVPDYLKHLYSN